LTGQQRHVGFTQIVTTTHGFAKTLGFASSIEHRHALDLHFEQQFNSSFDFGLGGVLQDFEDNCIGFISNHRGLFRHDRSDQDLHQTAFVKFQSAHANISLSFSTAALVINTLL
jgi:hypothetical protein